KYLTEKLAAASANGPMRSRVPFATIAQQWLTHMMPMYKASTQKNHRHILQKHLVPRFGEIALCELTRQRIQAFITELMQADYAPKSIDHIHDVLSAVLRTAVKWGHVPENPAQGVDLPRLRSVRPKWALTTTEAESLITALPPLPRTLVGLA